MRLKIKLKIILDILLLLAGLMSAITGIILFISPSGPGTHRGLDTTEFVFNLTGRILLKIFHNWSSIILIALVIFHLMLNWTTIVCYLKSISRVLKKQSSGQGCEN